MALFLQAPSPETQKWLAFGGVALFLIIGALLMALKIWSWLEVPLENLIVRILSTEEMKKKSREFIAAVANGCIDDHNTHADSHLKAMHAMSDEMKAEIGRQIANHDRANTSHYRILATREDLDGATHRLEGKIEDAKK